MKSALVMQWLVWTAFTIRLGNSVGVAFYSPPEDLAWCFMLGSSCLAPLFVLVQVYLSSASDFVEFSCSTRQLLNDFIRRNTQLLLVTIRRCIPKID